MEINIREIYATELGKVHFYKVSSTRSASSSQYVKYPVLFKVLKSSTLVCKTGQTRTLCENVLRMIETRKKFKIEIQI